MSNEELSFETAVAAYREVIGVDHSHDAEDCGKPEGFYLIGIVGEDGVVATYGGGHKMDPGTMVEAMVSVVDENLMQNLTQFPPIIRFTRSRDLIHNAADAVPASGEAAFALNQFAAGLGTEDDGGL